MALQNKITLIIDCNWYISASINKKSRRILYKLVTNPRYKIVYSEELLQEYIQVIKRDKFKKIIKLSQANRFIEFLQTRMIKVRIKETVRISRDKNDDYLLGLIKTSKADYLVTGDLDLLVLKNYSKARIITMKQFIEMGV